ncbi:ribosome-binding protein 1 isoform X2 [Dendrobates tinctorius]|uniref:ribosome-binding protein 1 isoform X2 n=1 Tax=Dendrobates tinctorius TaxID=92724 RepID=UPI003CCA28D7
MDIYDPQTLGVMVFGGFMVISAIGIVLVSSFSMKETSYEEALAKQRKEYEKGQPKVDKKKKEKLAEKKAKPKKKEDKPNGNLPEHQLTAETNKQKKVEREPQETVSFVTPIVTPALEKVVPSPKDRKKKQEKVQKAEPSLTQVVAVTKAVSKSPVLEASAKEFPVVAVPPVGAKQSTKLTPKQSNKQSPQAEAKPANKQSSQAEAKPGNKQAEAKPGNKQAAQAEGKPGNKQAAQAEGKPGNKQAAQAEGKPGNKQATQAEGKPGNKQAAQAEAKPGNKQAAQAEAKPGNKQAAQAEAKVGNKQAAQGEAKVGNKQAAQGEAKVGNKQAAQGEAKVGNKQAAQGEAKVGNKQAAQGEAKVGNKQAVQGEAKGGNKQAAQGEAKGGNKQAAQGEAKAGNKQAAQGEAKAGNKQAAQGDAKAGNKQAAQGDAKAGNKQAAQGDAKAGNKQAAQGDAKAGNKQAAQGDAKAGNKQAAQGDAKAGNKQAAQATQAEAKPGNNQAATVGAKPNAKQNASVTNTQTQPSKKAESVVSNEDHKQESAPKKKNVPKKKSEPVSSELDGALYLPYKTLVSTVSSMVFSEGEALKLIEILTERNGIKQDTWHTASQKGDPVAALRKQLEEKDKLLSSEQENAAAAKNKLREINKELSAEKTKVTSVEAKFKEQILSRDQEINALQARMQASYKDHLVEIQQQHGKIRALQDELENGPKAQLARLQQENSILRDALNQATSQTESKQNAELAKLRQECSKLSKELSEKSEALQQEEQKRKSVDGKISAYEKQVSQLETLQQESEASLQKRLDEVGEELRKSQNTYRTLLADTEKAKREQLDVADLQTKLMSYEAEGRYKSEELDKLNHKLQEVTGENVQLLERIKSIEVLLEAGQSNDAEKGKQQQECKEVEITQLHARLKEKEGQISVLEKEAVELKEAIEQQKNKNNELREKNWQAMDALGKAEKTCEEKLTSERKAKDDLAQQLSGIQTQAKEALMSLFPQVSVESHQLYSEWLQEFREKSSDALKQLSQPSDQTNSSDSILKLKEAEEAQVSLQAECEQYRTILGETEGMLKDLQKSVEEEEQVWKAKLEASEEELKKSQIEVKSLEESLERLKSEAQSTEQLKECIALMEAQLETQMNTSTTECQTYSKEVESLQQLLSESQEALESAKTEARKQSKELSLLRLQLSEMQNHVQDSHGSDGHQLKAPQSSRDEQNEEQSISEGLEERSVYSLQQELEKLKTAEEVSTGPEEAQQLKERLDKEKKLTRDLGQAANKLLQLLKASQEQLNKEKEQNKLLQNRLQSPDQDSIIPSGTSV